MDTVRFTFWLLLALAVVQILFYYPALPDDMASHFDGSGTADGWMSKQAFVIFDLCMLALTALTFLVLPKIRWPDRWINMPRKDYWLAPERRETTFRYIERQMLLIGCATMVLLLAVFQFSIEANLDGSETIPSTVTWWLVGGFVGLTMLWTARLVWHFYRGSADPTDPPAPDRGTAREPG